MYLIGVLRLSHSQQTLLERRNIIPIDLSRCAGIGPNDHYGGLALFLDYLHSRRTEDNRLEWPAAEDDSAAYSDTSDPDKAIAAWSKAIAVWKSGRRRYPGWTVVPVDRRRVLWLNTSNWVDKFPEPGMLPGVGDLEFAFELTWRTDKCLLPMLDSHAKFVEGILNRYLFATHPGARVTSTPVASTPADGTRDEQNVRRMCHFLLLEMMRYYREEGLTDKWCATCTQTESRLETLSPELRARFYYERAMFAMFSLKMDELKVRLAEWPNPDAFPFWNAKRAALLAEIGEMKEAERYLEQALEAIRAQSNLAPTRTDYTLESQESFVMFLLRAVRSPTGVDEPETREQHREFQNRWHVLQQFKCDPWHELEMFRSKLERPPIRVSQTTTTPAFDIGRYRRIYRYGTWDREALTAYNFLRFCEDTSIPFRLPGRAIATKSAAGTLPRIAKHSSYWAAVTLIRIGDTNAVHREVKAVDELFDRQSLAGMDPEFVDDLAMHYLEAARGAAKDIESEPRWGSRHFGTLLAELVPEILSRLCCKSSHPVRKEILVFLCEVYRSEHRGQYRGIRNLTERLLQAFTVPEQAAAIPRLLRFPILADLDDINKMEFLNPFSFLSSPQWSSVESPAIEDELLERFIAEASSEDLAARRWAITTLVTLHHWRLLEATRLKQFGAVLWEKTGEDGMPSGTNYHRHAFLHLPHPEGVNPRERFMRYVRSAQFPTRSRDHPVSLGVDIRESKTLAWPDDDLQSIVRRLIKWWDSEKDNLSTSKALQRLLGPEPNHHRKRMSDLASTLTSVAARRWDALDDESTRVDIRRVVAEMSERRIPTLAIETACLPLFPEQRETVLRRIEDDTTSSQSEVLADALSAVRVISERTVDDERLGGMEQDDLVRAMSALTDAIRWRDGKALSTVISAVAAFVAAHPWALVDDFERGVLLRLRRLIDDTAIPKSRAARIDEGLGDEDVSVRLALRQWAAHLAYKLFEHYRRLGRSVPDEVSAWHLVCQSEEEFAEIRRQWLR